MKTVFITTSPKKHHKLANSTYAAFLAKIGCKQAESIRLQGPKDYAHIENACAQADAVVFAMPLFVDSIPAHVLCFLKAMEQKATAWHCRVYVITCCGFYEGKQTALQCEQMRCWCQKVGLPYAGAVGIGASEMLGAIRFTNLFGCIPMGFLTGIITALCSGSLHSGLISGMISTIVPLSLYLLWSCGLFYHMIRLAAHIRKGKAMQDHFTTVSFCPRWLFTGFASIFWILRAAKNRVMLPGMWNRIDFRS